MVREEEIKKLARSIWEAEGCPDGRDWDHYFRAKRMPEVREKVLSNAERLRERTMSQGNSF